MSLAKKTEYNSTKTFTITLTAPRAVLYAIILLVAIIWFFTMGLILGRGYNPEEAIPELIYMLPQEGEAHEELTVTAPGQQPISEAVTPQIETPRLQPLIQDSQPAPTPVAGQQPAANLRATQQPLQAVQTSVPPASAKVPTPQQTTDPSFDYVYQVASFKSTEPASSFAAKVKASGLNSRVDVASSGSSTWYRVVVDFRGTADATRGLKDHVKQQFGIDKLLMVSKKEI